MSFSLHIKTDRFAAVTASAKHNLPLAVFMEGTEIMADSKENYVPVLTGNLRNTGHVDQPAPSGGGQFTVVLSYDAPYAGIVHEAPPGWGQGRRKYLETPVMAASRGFQSRVASRMQSMENWS